MGKSDRIAGFDGVRALAFLGVFANHKLEIAQRDALGSVGVWTFFVLSGFLITGILARSREEVEGGLPLRWALARFYLRRTARIFPIYYALLGCAFGVSLFVHINDFWLKEELAYATYTTNILIGVRDGWVGDFGHFWSLAVEEQFYLLFAPLALLIPRRRTALLCVAFLTAGLAARVTMEAAHAPVISIYVNSVVNFGLLGFGGLVGLAANRLTAPRWLTSGFAQGLVLAALVAAPIALGASHDAWMTFGPAIVVLSGLLLFQIAAAQGTWLVELLDASPLRQVGRVSYAAYLFHPFISYPTLQRLLGLAEPAPARWLQILAEFAITMALCAISWRVLEEPAIRWGARLSHRLFLAPAKPRALPAEAASIG